MACPLPSIDPLYQDLDHARIQFLDRLAEDDRNSFQAVGTPTDLNSDAVQFLTTFPGHKRTAKKMLRGVAGLVDALVPYFEVLGLSIQRVTAYAAGVWGSIFLILKMASRFPTLFDKLGELLLEVSTRIPQYRNLLERAQLDASLFWLLTASDNLNRSLRRLYRDLFLFFGDVGRVFTQKDESMQPSQALQVVHNPI
ncbi:uncharacterized protein PV07_00353 [Cladophialophora immunda]|uniref:Fungal STAND N-terminal Goodbye domain-containing protein n=1 Tax=Cladophialophora immunda TaxID=569365 RepID=A0A0D2B7I4_9EURO|nr:uncharacterized protein PV07_00353 [Cladophialophora immunda]KIW33507.1 hypothetical protein PV07_00353 [Cladophialophora immunda]